MSETGAAILREKEDARKAGYRRGVADERARAVRLAEEMVAATPSGMRSYDNSDRCDSRREALREFARRLKEGR